MSFDTRMWDGTKGRPTGCTVHSADVETYVVRTGYPACLAMLVDFLHSQLRGDGSDAAVAQAHRFALDWLVTTPVGADLHPAPSRIIVAALEEEQTDESSLAARQPEVARALENALDLHRRAIANDMPDRAAWAAARKAAIAATDATSEKKAANVGACIEAICWNPVTSRSVLVDMTRPWAQLRYGRALEASGWTEADEAAADTILQGFWEEQTAKREAGEFVDYRALFAARDPEFAERYASHFDVGNAAYPAAMRRFGDICLHVLATATCTEAA